MYLLPYAGQNSINMYSEVIPSGIAKWYHHADGTIQDSMITLM